MKLFAAVFLIFTAAAFCQPEIPALTMWATDLTSTLSQSELNDLNTRLKSFADTTSNQVIVLMIPSLKGYPIEMLAEETATKNKIGSAKHDNGILLLIAKDDRQIRIEVGYGLEGVVPDAIASSIIRNVITPQFRNDDYYAGISDGIDAIFKAIGGEYVTEENNEDSIIPIIFIVIFIIIMFLIRIKSGPFNSGGIYRTGSTSGGWPSGSSWGGSSGWSGGGGGFSGGGGSFGGGGASGSW